MVRSVFLSAALVALLALPAGAQDRIYVTQGGTGWLGISYETHWIQQGDRCEPQLFVDHVIQGSPAERAGLRAGDAILALDGERLPPSGLQLLSSRLRSGDSLSLRLRREGRERDVVAVAGQRPDRVASLFVLRSNSGLDASGAPIVEVKGDTLMVRNLDRAPRPGSAEGYWFTTQEGAAEYRRLGSWSRDDLDRRVVTLLRCAEEAQEAPVRIDIRRVQERADSLRVRIAERALARQQEEVRVQIDEGGAVTVRRALPEEDQKEAAAMGYVLRLEDYVTAGLRGVGGAEVTALEPELAEYFRNVETGLLVLRVAPDTPADRAGLRPGDVVTRVNDRRIDSVADLRVLLIRSGTVEMDIVRKGQRRTLTLRPK